MAFSQIVSKATKIFNALGQGQGHVYDTYEMLFLVSVTLVRNIDWVLDYFIGVQGIGQACLANVNDTNKVCLTGAERC